MSENAIKPSEFLKTEHKDVFINFLLMCTVPEWRKALLQYYLQWCCESDIAASYGIDFYCYTDHDTPEENGCLFISVDDVFDAVKCSICSYVYHCVEIDDASSDADQNRNLVERFASDEMKIAASTTLSNLVKMARYLIPGERAIYDAISEICETRDAHSMSSIDGIFHACYHDILCTADSVANAIVSRYKAHKGTTEVKQ